MICPDLGLAVIKHAGWRASQIATADEARIGLAGPPPSTELNPVTEARDYLESLALGCQREPGFELLLRQDGGPSRFLFPVGYGAVLSNMTKADVLGHLDGAFVQAIPTSQVIFRDELLSCVQPKHRSARLSSGGRFP